MLTEWEQGLLEDVSAERLMETTRSIARWVRLSGTEDEMRAVEYVRSLLDESGLRTEIIRHDAYISLPGAASLTLADGTNLPCITHSFAISTSANGLEGEMVDCGSSEVAALGAVVGRIALLDGLAMPERVRAVEVAGAIGQIYVNGPLTHEIIVSPVWGSPGRGTRHDLPHTPVLSIDAATAKLLREQLASGIRSVRMLAEVDTRWRQTPILIASLPAASTEDFVLFSGHIDSWHYGAMDNGSANATMVEVARLMAQHRDQMRRGLRLAFWSGHSHGRYAGSTWYADNYWSELRRHCVAHVNIDSVGGRGATVLSEGIAMAATRALGAGAIRAITGETFHGGRVGRSGDQSFVGLGIPSLWMSLSEQPPTDDPTAAAFAQLVGESRSGGLGWWWHTTEDTLDKIDPGLLQRDARIYALGLGRLLTARLLPFLVSAEAEELVILLEQLQQAVGDVFDLTSVVELARMVQARAEELDAWAREQADEIGDIRGEDFNRTVSEVLRALIPINYTASGPFGHDPALTMSPLPLLSAVTELAKLPLDSDEARFLKVDLVRARNCVLSALEGALTVANRGLATLEPTSSVPS